MADIKGVEIFAEGIWNGNRITSDMLKEIVDNFKSAKTIRPVLKLGHNDEQKLLAQDGLPAAGWVNDIYIKGKKILADFSDIPQKIANLIKKKAYRKVSVEIFRNVTLEGKKYNNLLGAVALLGSDTPAVLSLDDIPTDFSLSVENSLNFTSDESSRNIMTVTMNREDQMPEAKDKDKSSELEKLIADQEKTIKDLQSKISKFSKTSEDIESYKKRISDLEKENESTQVDKFSLDLKSKDLISPSMEPFIKALASHIKVKQEFSIKDKKYTGHELITELLTLAKEVYKINTEEKSKDIEPEKKDGYQDQNQAIEEYMNKHKVTYRQAYTAVMVDKKQA